jgi:large subunit ribosomal protein L25
MAQQTKSALKVARREVLGKKVSQLRRQGVTPANIYGNHVDSVAIQLSTDEFRTFVRGHGRNEIIYLSVDGEERPTFIREVHRNPVTDMILHIDFLQVSLDQKVKLEVPVHLIGMSSAVDTFGGVLTHQLNSISVEALPTNIPSMFEADISVLTELGQSLHVSSLVAPEGVDILTDPESVIARIDIPAAERAEEVEAVAGEEGEEGAPAEGAPAPAEESGGESE